MKATFSVKSNSEFQRAYKKGVRKSGRYIAVSALKNSRGRSRLGITVGKKFGNSVQRNRFKRLVRESFRTVRNSLNGNFDIIVTARASQRAAATPGRKLRAVYVPSYGEIHRELCSILRSLQILVPAKNSDRASDKSPDKAAGSAPETQKSAGENGL